MLHCIRGSRERLGYAWQGETGLHVAKSLLLARAREAANPVQPPVKAACGPAPAAVGQGGVVGQGGGAVHLRGSTKRRLGRRRAKLQAPADRVPELKQEVHFSAADEALWKLTVYLFGGFVLGHVLYWLFPPPKKHF